QPRRRVIPPATGDERPRAVRLVPEPDLLAVGALHAIEHARAVRRRVGAGPAGLTGDERFTVGGEDAARRVERERPERRPARVDAEGQARTVGRGRRQDVVAGTDREPLRYAGPRER